MDTAFFAIVGTQVAVSLLAYIVTICKEKRLAYYQSRLCGCSTPIPINFLEKPSDRLILAALFGYISSSIFVIYSTSDSVSSVTIFLEKLLLALVELIVIYPLFLCKSYIYHTYARVFGLILALLELTTSISIFVIATPGFSGILSLLPSFLCITYIVLYFAKANYVYFKFGITHFDNTEHIFMQDYAAHVKSLLVSRRSQSNQEHSVATAFNRNAHLLAFLSSQYSTSKVLAQDAISFIISAKVASSIQELFPFSTSSASQKALGDTKSFFSNLISRNLYRRFDSPGSGSNGIGNENDNENYNDNYNYNSNNNGSSSSESTSILITTLTQNKKNSPIFHYSARLVSTFVIVAVVVFQIVVHSPLPELLSILEAAEFIPNSALTATVWLARFFTLVICYGSVASIVQSFKNHSIQLRKGGYGPLPGIARQFNTRHKNRIIDAIRYPGYQIAYFLLGGQLVIYVIFGIFFAFLWFVTGSYWSYLVPSVTLFVVVFLVTFIQSSTVKYLFSQDNSISITNRRWFMNFDFFNFFITIVLGTYSFLLRFLKVIVGIVLFFTRLDRPFTFKGFEEFDDGFQTYVALLYFENYYNNPTVLIAQACFLYSRKKLLALFANQSETNLTIHDFADIESQSNIDQIVVDDNEVNPFAAARRTTVATSTTTTTTTTTTTARTSATNEATLLVPASTRSKKLRNKWQLAYTLVKNPILIPYRAHHLETLTLQQLADKLRYFEPSQA